MIPIILNRNINIEIFDSFYHIIFTIWFNTILFFIMIKFIEYLIY
jgi:hypothetical protein